MECPDACQEPTVARDDGHERHDQDRGQPPTDPGERVAERVPVKFGKASVNQIVVLEGLEPGDIVALADTTQWSGKDRLVID